MSSGVAGQAIAGIAMAGVTMTDVAMPGVAISNTVAICSAFGDIQVVGFIFGKNHADHKQGNHKLEIKVHLTVKVS